MSPARYSTALQLGELLWLKKPYEVFWNGLPEGEQSLLVPILAAQDLVSCLMRSLKTKGTEKVLCRVVVEEGARGWERYRRGNCLAVNVLYTFTQDHCFPSPSAPCWGPVNFEVPRLSCLNILR